MKRTFRLFSLSILTISLILTIFTLSFAQKAYDVAVLLPGAVEFFSVQRIGIDKAGKDFGLNITYADAEWDAGKQLSQVENFIIKKVDAIMLCAADNIALIPAVKLCNDANIPIITFTNSLGTDTEGKFEGVVSYIGRSEVGAGIIQAEMAEQLLGEEGGNIVLIEGESRNRFSGLREEGLCRLPKLPLDYSGKRPIEGWTKEGSLAL